MDFIVKRANLRESKFDSTTIRELSDGEARLKITKFAFTANNVTYGAAGDLIGYWNFFPASGEWGRIPVWGIAAVDESHHVDLPVGERLYGYLPMSTDLIIQPASITTHGLIDASLHRSSLPPVYNQYTRLAAQPGYDRAQDDRMMLLQPLFMTAFLLDDYLADSDFFGAESVVLSSASSKTAFSLASLLSRNRSCEVVGLTSPGNIAFVQGLGCYDRVVAYADIDSLPTTAPTVLVDMAGSAQVVRAIHEHFGSGVKHSSQVGMTHWEERGATGDLPGARPEFFFAPAQIDKRRQDWGASGFQQRSAESWQVFLNETESWLEIVHGRGPDDVRRVYLDSVSGRIQPSQGHILSLA